MSKLILLIEDNPTDEKLALLAFKKSGVSNDIIVQRDGADALEYLFATGRYLGRDESIQPCVILLDLQLPRIDGLEVLRRVREDPRTTFIPVVILTSSKQDEDVVRSYQLRANAYVRKPVDFLELAEAAKALGAFWLHFNTAPPGSLEKT